MPTICKIEPGINATLVLNLKNINDESNDFIIPVFSQIIMLMFLSELKDKHTLLVSITYMWFAFASSYSIISFLQGKFFVLFNAYLLALRRFFFSF